MQSLQELTSIKNIHLHPACPSTPLILNNPYAKNPATISAMLIAVQKKLNRIDSS